jgi:hypothetical protein
MKNEHIIMKHKEFKIEQSKSKLIFEKFENDNLLAINSINPDNIENPFWITVEQASKLHAYLGEILTDFFNQEELNN